MHKWIVEADIYRLHKQLRESSWPEERARLLDILDQKYRLLGVKGTGSIRTDAGMKQPQRAAS